MGVGELSALGSAVLWASSSVLLRTQTTHMPVLLLNALRLVFASIVVWMLAIGLGQTAHLASVPIESLGGLLASVVVGMAIGDSLNLRAMHAIGVSRAMPIASSYPILTAILATVWLGEPLTPRIVLGIVLVVAGVYIIAFPIRGRTVGQPIAPTSNTHVGVALALGASVCWALSTVVVRPALEHVDPILANGIRLPVACLILLTLSAGRRKSGDTWRIGIRSTSILACSGAMSGFSGALWLVGVRYAGAAKAATLSSTTPIFAGPLAALFLGERLTPQIGIGTICSVVGVWLVL